jgi:hypothetical protein
MSHRDVLIEFIEEDSGGPDFDHKDAKTPERRASSAALPPSPVSMPWPKKSLTGMVRNTKGPPSHPVSAPSAPSADEILAENFPRNRWRRAIRKVIDNHQESHSWPLALHSLQQVAEEVIQRTKNSTSRPIHRWNRAIRVVMRRNLARKRNLAMTRWRSIVMKVLEWSTIRRTDSQALSSPYSACCDTLVRISGGESSYQNCSCQAFSSNENFISLCACGHLEMFHEARKVKTVERAHSSPACADCRKSKVKFKNRDHLDES